MKNKNIKIIVAKMSFRNKSSLKAIDINPARAIKMETDSDICTASRDPTRNIYEINNESVVFVQNDLFPSAFPTMEEIRRQGKLCDVVLKIDDQSFSAHKIVLASTIPYFHAMFTNDMVESRQQEIFMQGLDAW